ncbi:MAG: PspC domain-containing protein [Aeromicrobium erythreum]
MDTQEQAGPTAAGDDTGRHGPTAERFRTLTEARRDDGDRMIAGVASGLARHLDLDPVLVRVLLAVLTIVGGAGLILYAGCWLLLPSDSADRSLVADWFRLDANERQVRVVGLAVTAALAVLSVVGDGGWGPGLGWVGWTAFWVAVPVLGLYYVFGVLPRRRREGRTATATAAQAPPTAPGAVAATTTAPTGPADSAAPAGPAGSAGAPPATTLPPRPSVPPRPPRPPRPPWSPALLVLVAATTAIALGGLALVELLGGTDLAWPTYVATALGVVGLGLVAGAWWGNPGVLVPVALLLAAALTLGTLLPNARIGQSVERPTTAAEVERAYDFGIGELKLDLSAVDDPTALEGRTIEVHQGIGRVLVTVPDGLKVHVLSRVRAGDLKVLGAEVNGTERRLEVGDPSPTALTIDARVGLGQVEVVSR